MATSKTIEGLYEVGPDQKLQVKQPIWKSLFFQIGVAIVLGITIGALWPAIGSQLKPIGDGFIRLNDRPGHGLVLNDDVARAHVLPGTRYFGE